ncbi:DUF4038 domain-containing protein [bacterium]|nr:MAG: DUF4038 domain-containing protein [bacterium]
MQRPRVSADGRHLAFPDGAPFFWLGDTAWELFHRLSREEAEHFLKTRAEQGFNVIQAVGLAEYDGLRVPNREGHLPLHDLDPSKPNEPYWKHVDWVVEQAAKNGLYVGLVPTWGDKINKSWGIGPVVFDEKNAHAYGRFLGRRYAHHDNVIWINGGDRDPADRKAVWRALASGLTEGDDSHERLMTFHPQGERSSADDFHDDKWLDLNMLQTGHGNPDLGVVRRMMRASYERTPVKPVIDGEPRYENHPIGFNMTRGYYDAGDVRQACYTGVFLGGAGVTYGCHAIWQFAQDRFEPVNNPISHWRYSLGLPGANQMRHLKELMLSLPFLQMRPDFSAPMPTLSDGKTTLIYTHDGSPITLNTVKAEWFDPTTGKRQPASGGPNFTPPKREGRVNDWVLIAN